MPLSSDSGRWLFRLRHLSRAIVFPQQDASRVENLDLAERGVRDDERLYHFAHVPGFGSYAVHVGPLLVK